MSNHSWITYVSPVQIYPPDSLDGGYMGNITIKNPNSAIFYSWAPLVYLSEGALRYTLMAYASKHQNDSMPFHSLLELVLPKDLSDINLLYFLQNNQ